jgi:hypothetical protein
MAAPEVPIRGGDAQVKLRNPVNTELGDSPATSVLAIVPGALIIVPPFVTYWTTNGRILKSQAMANVPAGEQINQAVSFILLLVFAPIGIWWMQNELNKVWARETDGGAAVLEEGAARPAMASPAPGEAQPAEQPAPPSA